MKLNRIVVVVFTALTVISVTDAVSQNLRQIKPKVSAWLDTSRDSEDNVFVIWVNQSFTVKNE